MDFTEVDAYKVKTLNKIKCSSINKQFLPDLMFSKYQIGKSRSANARSLILVNKNFITRRRTNKTEMVIWKYNLFLNPDRCKRKDLSATSDRKDISVISNRRDHLVVIKN